MSTIRISIIIEITQYHIVVLKRQNGLKVETEKPKEKVQMQSVSDDDVQKRELRISADSPGKLTLVNMISMSFSSGRIR